jgi:hypothetical protein
VSLPSSRILLIGPVPSRIEPADALELLRPADLPKLTKCLLTDAKFDTKRAAKTFNIEADYPPETALLRTLAGWSGLGDDAAEALADGLEVFALRSVVDRDGPFGTVIVQRSPSDFTQRWSALIEQLGNELYLELGQGNVVLNLNAGSKALLDALWTLYETGAVYGFSDYSFSAALAAAADSVRLSG